MKKYLFFSIIIMFTLSAQGQNQLRIRGGVISTNTSVSEYSRGINYFYYDSVTLDTRTTSPQATIDIDLDIGKGFFLATGLSYSKKGLPSIYYINGDYWYDAYQYYLGMNFQLKYHYKFRDEKFGIFGAAGFKTDFAVGEPTNAQVATDEATSYFHSFGTFNQIDFSLATLIGCSYKLGPGDITLDLNFQEGLSDVISDQFIVGRTFSVGICMGYSFYFQ